MPEDKLKIDKNGVWYHGQTTIDRMGLLRLFYSALKRIDKEYFIVTPSERVRVDVEDAPYCVRSFIEQGPSHYELLLNDETTIPLDEEHPLRLAESGMLYVSVKNGLEARFNLASFASIGKHLVYDDQGRLTIHTGEHTMVIETAA